MPFILIPKKYTSASQEKTGTHSKNTEYIYFVIIIIRFKHYLKKIKCELKILKKMHSRNEKKIQTHRDCI